MVDEWPSRDGLDGFGARLAWAEEVAPPWSSTLPPLPCPTAAGEHCYSPLDFLALDAMGIDVWQPDAVFCGGVTSLVEIADMAAARGRTVAAHGGGFLPAVHAAVAGAPIARVEHHLLLEPRRQAHYAEPLVPATSVAPVPTAPGWAGPLSPDLEILDDDGFDI